MSKKRILEAVQKLDLATTKKVLRARPALLTATHRDGRNLLHLACSARGAATGMVKFLLDQGMDVDTPVGKDRCTPLFFAVARGRNPNLARLLIERGAKPSNAPGGGLFAAAWWDDTKSVDLLIRHGAKIDVVVGITPFLAAWCWKRFSAAKRLALRGADVNYRDRKGKTALHHGIEKEFEPALLRWLVQHGASPDIEDRDGITPRLRASRKRDKRYLRALEAS